MLKAVDSNFASSIRSRRRNCTPNTTAGGAFAGASLTPYTRAVEATLAASGAPGTGPPATEGIADTTDLLPSESVREDRLDETVAESGGVDSVGAAGGAWKNCFMSITITSVDRVERGGGTGGSVDGDARMIDGVGSVATVAGVLPGCTGVGARAGTATLADDVDAVPDGTVEANDVTVPEDTDGAGDDADGATPGIDTADVRGGVPLVAGVPPCTVACGTNSAAGAGVLLEVSISSKGEG